MVSQRCEMVVRDVLNKLGFQYANVKLGVVKIPETISLLQLNAFKQKLSDVGLELINNKKNILTERIKNVIIEMLYYSNEIPKVNYSQYISPKLNHDYTYLSNVFAEVMCTTIQQFIIKHKIEKVKELLLYNELNLTEIS